MIEVPLFTWYWIGGLVFTVLSLISLAVWFSYFWNPHIDNKNL
jgi:hypothetical protein